MSEEVVPEAQKVRLFLQVGEDSEYIYIAWFELRGKDFYWGPANPGPDVPSVPFSGTSVTLEIPDGIRGLPTATWKASRHESGVLHVNASGESDKGMSDVYVGPITQITEPTPFAVVLEKVSGYLPKYKRSLTRKNARAVVIRVPDSVRNHRAYFEFYLSPAGEFTAPPVVLSVKDAPSARNSGMVAHSLSAELDIVLVIRHLTMTSGSSDLHPDIGYWMTLSGSPGAP